MEKTLSIAHRLMLKDKLSAQTLRAPKNLKIDEVISTRYFKWTIGQINVPLRSEKAISDCDRQKLPLIASNIPTGLLG